MPKRTRWWIASLFVVICTAAQIANACPYCKADAAGLAATAPPSADDAASFPIMISGGLDYASAFYFRGYLQADHGTIAQPYFNIFTTQHLSDDLVVRPYVSFFNSTHFAPNNPMADMNDVMVGAVSSFDGWTVDTRYAYYTMSPMMRTPVHEIGMKASFDVLTLWNEPDSASPFSLKPFAGAFADSITALDTVQLYAQVGIEPTWRFEFGGTKVGLGLPLEWGLGANRYYFNTDGSNAALGYFSGTLTASFALPIPDEYGKWFINSSLQYLHLAADSTQIVGQGRNDVCIGKVGVSFVF